VANLLNKIFGDNVVANSARAALQTAGAGIPGLAERMWGDPRVADQTDQMLAQSRANAGLAGDIAHYAGYFAPAGLALRTPKLLRAGAGVIREGAAAIPAAERAITSLIPQSAARAVNRTRLGLPELPTYTEQAGKVVGNIAANAASALRAHPILTALGAAGVGIPAFADYANRGAAAPAAAAPTAAKPKAQAQAKPAMSDSDKKLAQIEEALKAVDQQPVTFEDMAGQLAAGQGGKLSLRQLAALSEIGQRNYRRPVNMPAKDVAGREYLDLANQSFAAQQGAAKQVLDDPNSTPAQKQAALAAGQKAVADHMTALKGLMPGDPFQEFLAEQARARAEQDDGN
jgi:hypothetical protein